MRRLLRVVAVLMIVAVPGLASAPDKFFNSNGVEIRYVERGSGEPIILLHGFATDIEPS